MRVKHTQDLRDFLGRRRIEWQSQVNHTAMWLPLAKDEITEVSIVRDQNSVFSDCQWQDIPIREGRWVLSGNRGNVVSERDQGTTDA